MIESQLLLKHKKEKQLLQLTIIAAAINFGLSIFLIPIWGVKGAMIAGIIGKLILARLIVNQSRNL